MGLAILPLRTASVCGLKTLKTLSHYCAQSREARFVVRRRTDRRRLTRKLHAVREEQRRRTEAVNDIESAP